MTPIRTAIIGCGGIAERHARNMAALPDHFQLVACADTDEARAHDFAARFTPGADPVADPVAVYADSIALLDASRQGEVALDALVICLPPFAHRDEVARAATQHLHVLIEKPIALDSARAWQMVAAAEAAGIITQVGFMYRFGAAIAHLKQLIASGAAGSVGLMSTRYFCNSLHAPWWRDRSKSGGQLVEQVIHMIDLMRYLMGEAETVYSIQRNLYHTATPGYTVEDTSGTVISFQQGGIGVIYASNNAIPGRWINDYKIVAATLTADFADANHALFHHTAGSSVHTEEIASDDDVYLLELEDFHQAIVTGRAARTPMREGARSLDLALAARASAEANAVQRVPALPAT